MAADCIPGGDGALRSCTVRTRSGTTRTTKGHPLQGNPRSPQSAPTPSRSAGRRDDV
jgi:hypothetical protein